MQAPVDTETYFHTAVYVAVENAINSILADMYPQGLDVTSPNPEMVAAAADTLSLKEPLARGSSSSSSSFGWSSSDEEDGSDGQRLSNVDGEDTPKTKKSKKETSDDEPPKKKKKKVTKLPSETEEVPSEQSSYSDYDEHNPRRREKARRPAANGYPKLGFPSRRPRFNQRTRLLGRRTAGVSSTLQGIDTDLVSFYDTEYE
jgi:hypothetical protein